MNFSKVNESAETYSKRSRERVFLKSRHFRLFFSVKSNGAKMSSNTKITEDLFNLKSLKLTLSFNDKVLNLLTAGSPN
jgi:hypothetical protein